MNTKLSCTETVIYFCGWTFAAIYSFYYLYKAQNVALSNTQLEYLLPGWQILQRNIDNSDIEWHIWKYYIKTAWPYIIFHFITSEIIRKVDFTILKYWYIISSLFFILNYTNIIILLFFLVQPTIFLMVTFFNGRRFSIWATSILILIILNIILNRDDFWHYLDSTDIEIEKGHLIYFSIFWIHTKCISYTIDYIKDEKYSKMTKFYVIIDIFSYILYQPLFIFGPTINYEVFERSFLEQKSLMSRLKIFAWDISLFVIYSIIMEVLLHYIYFNAMHRDDIEQGLSRLPPLALFAGLFWVLMHFHAKYVIMYGVTEALSRLDHIEAPPTPRCPARIHLYSDMWRYFDVGLYRFLVKYIYIPTYNYINIHTTVTKTTIKLISSFTTFIFIFLWHGIHWQILVWTSLNFISLSIEQIGKAIGETKKYLWFKENILRTDAMEVRFKALICPPLLMFSIVSNFYFVGGMEQGNFYFSLFSWPTLSNFVIMYSILYCFCHVSIALQGFPSRRDLKKV